MIRILKSLSALAIMAIVCCTTNISAQENKQQPDISKKALNFKRLALGKDYIHVDTSLINSKGVYQGSIEVDSVNQVGQTRWVQQLVYKNDMIPFMAATYRFYKNLKIIDGLYVTTLTSGKNIQISEAVFMILKNNMDQLNVKIKAILKNEGKIEMTDIDKYLDWMLEHDWSTASKSNCPPR